MADKTKLSYQLKLLAGFADGDTRTITLENPKPNLTASEINAINALAAGVLIGDKYGAAFAELKDANIVETQTTYLDLEP